ncbi:MAG: VWA domain-containing protein [Salibacteraceae bacterium]
MLIGTLLLAGSLLSTASGQQFKEPLSRILFIYDASNSMMGQWQSGDKNKVAKRLLGQALDSLKGQPNVQVALRVYGHTKFYKQDRDCEDTELVVPFSARNHDKIKTRLGELRPKGTTLIAYSLEQAANDFPPCKDCRNIIILITDGIEECGGDPCAVSMALQRKGIILKPFVIGVGLDIEFKKTFECIGNFYDASNESTFQDVLGIVISQALNSTSAQVNLLDIAGNPTETNVNMTFYDQFSGRMAYNYVHTMNGYGNPDTLKIDPVINYKLVVHTIPQVVKDSIELTAGTHNIIGVDAAQGSLLL